MTPISLRPENRQRSAVDADRWPETWVDTTPMTFRSEAFAEDLASADDTRPAGAAAGLASKPALILAGLAGLLALVGFPGR